jgi:hypothetical protein
MYFSVKFVIIDSARVISKYTDIKENNFDALAYQTQSAIRRISFFV